MGRRRRTEPKNIAIATALVAAIAVVIGVAVWADGRGSSDGADATPATVPTTSEAVGFEPIVATNGRPQPVVAVFGDSYTEGAGATNPRTQGYLAQLSDELGWEFEISSLSGGGYVNPGKDKSGPIAKKIAAADLAKMQPNAVLIQAGLNDKGLLTGDVVKGVQDSINAARDAVPDVPVIVVGLLWGQDEVPDFVRKTSTDISSVAMPALRTVYIDTWDLRFPQISDNIHPTTEGHAAIATFIADDLRAQGLTQPQATTE
jgi:lysophospholipase L1-like esterase